MYTLRPVQFAAYFLAATSAFAATPEAVSVPPCSGMPATIGMGGACPPHTAHFCVLDGRACQKSVADSLLANVRVTHGDSKICRQFIREEPEHVAFDREHRLSQEEAITFLFGASSGFAGTLDMGKSAAYFDANNDGTSDFIVPASIPGGRYCSTLAFIPTNESLTAIVKGPLASTLEQLRECPGSLPVRLNGTSYFETRSSLVGNYGTKLQVLWKVHLIRGTSMTKMCEFRYRWPKEWKNLGHPYP